MSADTHSIVSIKILINGSEIKESYDIVDIKVIKQVNRISFAKVKIIDGSVSKEGFELSSSDEVIPGKEIDIQAGFGLKTSSIFKGVITAQNIQSRSNAGSVLILECKDKAAKMTIGQNNGVFTDKKDSEVMSTLASNHGLSIDAKATTTSYPQLIQYNSTDWDFLLSRAEVNGMIVTTNANKISVQPPKTSGAVETLTFGENIFELNTRMNAESQLADVKSMAWDFKNQKLVDASASPPSVPSQGNLTGKKLADVLSPKEFNLYSTANLDEGELKSWADGQLLKSRLAKIIGEVKAFGNGKIEPNTVIKLAGMGKRFNGDAYVSGVVHEISEGNWFSNINIGLDPQWFAKAVDVSAKPASALLPGISGLQNATVKQIYEDPDNETRIQVDIPIFKNSGESLLWARWVQPYASSGVGIFFMPEVDDEVVVGFLNDDPRYPVILGSMYSSQKAPPETPAEKNPKKVILTQSKIKIEFDDENKVLTITTPGENKMIYSDQDQSITIQDQNSNKITMDSGGIELNSPKDIKLTAEGSVTISGTAGVTVSSEASTTISGEAGVSVSGLEVSVSAETSFSASGGAEASVSGGGELSLSGAMVMIN